MKVRALPLLTGLAVLVLPASAAASSLSLTMEQNDTLKRIGERSGGPVYGQQGLSFLQVFRVQVLDDAGTPVATCLGDGALVEVVSAKGKVIGSSTCTGGDGFFRVFPKKRVVEPAGFVARIVTGSIPLNGNPVSPGTSNPIVLMIAPKLTDTSPFSVRGNRPYPITGKVDMPQPASKGTIVLERRDGSKWTRVGSTRTTRFGRYAFSVRIRTSVTRFRVRFVPRNPKLWLPTSYEFRIRRTL